MVTEEHCRLCAISNYGRWGGLRWAIRLKSLQRLAFLVEVRTSRWRPLGKFESCYVPERREY